MAMRNSFFLFLFYMVFGSSLFAQTINANELKKIYALSSRSAIASYLTNNGFKLRDAKSFNYDFQNCLFEEWYKGNQRFYLHIQEAKVDGLVWYTDNEQLYLNAYTSILEIQGVSMNVNMNSDRNKTIFTKDDWMFETVKQKKFTEFYVGISKKGGLLDVENGKKTYYMNNDVVYKKFTLKNGQYDGEYILNHANGKIDIKAYFKEGKKNGKYFTYNDKGNVLFDFNYLDDKKEGLCKEMLYDSLGKLSTYAEYTCVGGEIDGYFIKKAYVNGREILVSNFNMSKGLRHGEFTYINDENLYVVGRFNDDSLEGEVLYYKDYDFTADKVYPRTDLKVLKLYAKQVYENGRLIQRTFYNEDGTEQ